MKRSRRDDFAPLRTRRSEFATPQSGASLFRLLRRDSIEAVRERESRIARALVRRLLHGGTVATLEELVVRCSTKESRTVR